MKAAGKVIEKYNELQGYYRSYSNLLNKAMEAGC